MMLKHTYRYLLLIILFLSGCQDSEDAPQQALTLEEEQVLLGNPSGATADESNYNNYLMTKPQFALSYSRDRSTPNRVSWHVSRDWLGSAPRQNNFRADPELPQGWYRVTTSSNTVRPDWGTYRTTVDALEQATGYDMLSALPVQVQQALEGQVDTGPTR